MSRRCQAPYGGSSQAAPASSAARAWHALTVDEVRAQTGADVRGLAADEAHRRHEAHGANELARMATTSAWQTLAAQFRSVLILILIAATVASGLMGHVIESAAILVIVCFAVGLGFVQEYRAGRAIDALRRMAAPQAHVRRDGHERTIASREVVVGDVLLVHAGDRVAADARVTAAFNLAMDEAALTGESMPVRKSQETIAGAGAALGDRPNMLYTGTLAASGRGEAIVVAIGGDTEFGAISRLVQTVEAGRTPLQENLDRVGAMLGKAAGVIVATIVVLGLWRGESAVEMLMFGIALAVAVVPEALPAVVTISLAIGVRRMVKRNVLVRRLQMVETLGTTSVICSDKTGTLTRNEMTVRHIVAGEAAFTLTGIGYAPEGVLQDARGEARTPPPEVLELLTAGVLASDAELQETADGWRIEGDPTEGALVVAAAKVGIDPQALREQRPRVDEIPFSSDRRRMTTVHRTPDGMVAYSKGAADAILPDCDHECAGGADRPLSAARRERLAGEEHEMAAQGLRVLALARKRRAGDEDHEHGMTLLGFVGMMDPPRAEAREAVRRCESAGITPVIVTGDHPLTTRSVAMELGLLKGRVVTGADLQQMDAATLDREIDQISVFARVSPADKLRVVEAWQRRGAVVAVTGDGVNDAPALKRGDVGIAMGITGTDVSKEAAGITLLDDNFASIVAAIEEGRLVFANIRKYLGYLLSSNVGEIVLMAAATAAGLPLPLTAVQILYVNLATDGLPALALAVDPPDADVMQKGPRDPRSGIFTPHLVQLIVLGGLWAGLINTALFAWMLQTRDIKTAMALTFVSLVLTELVKAFNYRSLHRSVAGRVFGNHWLNAAVAWELLVFVVVIYTPVLQAAFGTFALAPSDWLLVAGVALSIVPVIEAIKFAQRRRPLAAA